MFLSFDFLSGVAKIYTHICYIIIILRYYTFKGFTEEYEEGPPRPAGVTAGTHGAGEPDAPTERDQAREREQAGGQDHPVQPDRLAGAQGQPPPLPDTPGRHDADGQHKMCIVYVVVKQRVLSTYNASGV